MQWLQWWILRLMSSLIHKAFQGKSVLITGGSSGIGLALAEDLASVGAIVTILARNQERLLNAAEAIKSHSLTSSQQIIALQGDIANRCEITRILTDYIHQHGIPDILINSAGVVHPGEFLDLSPDLFDWMMDINFHGTVNVTRIIVPGMIERRSGIIINIASFAAILGVFGYTAYSASKFALRGFSDALRSEIRPHNIQVSIVYPWDTQTPQLEYENQYKPELLKILDESGKVMSAKQVSQIILRDVARRKQVITPGFDATLYYHMANFLGPLTYHVLDLMILQAKQTLKKRKQSIKSM
ncbi:MAG TPA: SDR family oxidoreductase [Anaerolineaceae bacterium]